MRRLLGRRVLLYSTRRSCCQMPNEPNPLSDQIHIEQLEISTRIGVPEKERATPQRLTVSISFWPYYDKRDMDDKIDNTVNYSIVAEETKNFARNLSTNLIETLADRLATHLLKTFRIQKIIVELRKFPLEDAKHVSVTVTRTASVA
jgi:7,8-dihydroneopterin aldolase/epimerase/oxygenase